MPHDTTTCSDGALRRDLRAIWGDGIGFSLMVGAGETYVPAFALALGMTAVAGGLVSSVPLLGGALLQLAAPWGVRRFGSYRRWVTRCVVVQALCYTPFAIAALRGAAPAAAIYAVAMIYWASGMAAGPAWNAWVGGIVPERMRAPYWARRTRWAHASLLAGLLLGGAVLQTCGARPGRLWPFALLFAFAAACRLLSARCLATQSDRPLATAPSPYRPLAALARLGRGPDGRLLLAALATTFAVQIAGPFFNPYLLRELHLPYAQYVLLLAVSCLAKIVSLPLLGRMARRHGTRVLQGLGLAGIVPLPALWLVSPALPWLVCINVASGIAWAAYELALFLALFEAIDASERTEMLTAYNLASALATLGGSLCGGALLGALGAGAPAYAAVFAVSTLARALVLAAARRLPVRAADAGRDAWLALRPALGFGARPLLPAWRWSETDQEETLTNSASGTGAVCGSPRDTTTAAARSPVTLSVVRHMSRKRSTPRMSPMPSGGTPTMPRMIAMTGIDPAGTPAVPMPPSTHTMTTVACCANDKSTP
jgi:MFS family permease